ncbi:hypothetical protein J4Q44_G00082870 [Coregonus suidteri]|uniref:Uncharacterized protein n=1 Tax=Coregonus suidteri TaxID=861788 RepID=A0AAN8MAF0_9TELE
MACSDSVSLRHLMLYLIPCVELELYLWREPLNGSTRFYLAGDNHDMAVSRTVNNICHIQKKRQGQYTQAAHRHGAVGPVSSAHENQLSGHHYH